MSKSVKSFLYPLITGVVLVILWFASIRIFSVPNYLLPTPEAVLNTLRIGYVEANTGRTSCSRCKAPCTAT